MITLKENIEYLKNLSNWHCGLDESIETPAVAETLLHLDYAIERLQSLYNDEWDEARVDVLGQNGNDALHYDKI